MIETTTLPPHTLNDTCSVVELERKKHAHLLLIVLIVKTEMMIIIYFSFRCVMSSNYYFPPFACSNSEYIDIIVVRPI